MKTKVSPDALENDHLLVALLIDNDEDAWTYTIQTMAAPLVYSKKMNMVPYFRKYSIPLNSIFTPLYRALRKNNCAVLRNFRYESCFRTYLYRVIENLAKDIRKKHREENERYVLSENTSDGALIDMTHDWKTPETEATAQEARQQGNEYLAQLWKDNPTYAFVLLLRNDLKMHSNDVATLLGKNQAYIDQLNHRAQSKLNDYRKAKNEE